MDDLNDVIEGALDDLGLDDDTLDIIPEPEAPAEVPEPEDQTEVPPVEVSVEEKVAAQTETPEAKVEEPAAPAEDDFDTKYDFPAKSTSGRENRLPHSRVKTMVLTAEKNGYEKAKKELESTFTPRLTEFETKIKTYEEKLAKNGDLEILIDTKPKDFMLALAKHPTYKEFFEYVNKAVEAFEQKAAPPAQTTSTPAATTEEDPIPQPNQTLQDGSKVYDLDGVKALLDWKGRQVEKQVLGQVEEKLARLTPIQQEWEQAKKNRDYIAQVQPVIDQQLKEAREKWPNFTELEKDIEDILTADTGRTMSLDRAYMQAYQAKVVPKLSVDKNKMRAELLAELKRQPNATSTKVVPTTPAATAPPGKRPLEDIITEELRKVGLI
ncbi:hypothetical protein HY346_01475 [Candidatus Microgenomates bacterium]|nr:hypothetical protein [Candidatus Microgenomates bacterium]